MVWAHMQKFTAEATIEFNSTSLLAARKVSGRFIIIFPILFSVACCWNRECVLSAASAEEKNNCYYYYGVWRGDFDGYWT